MSTSGGEKLQRCISQRKHFAKNISSENTHKKQQKKRSVYHPLPELVFHAQYVFFT